VIESNPTTGYSKLRVAFENTELKSSIHKKPNNIEHSSALTSLFSPRGDNTSYATKKTENTPKKVISATTLPYTNIFDVVEPFYIERKKKSPFTLGMQALSFTPGRNILPGTPFPSVIQSHTSPPSEVTYWSDPDETFLNDVKKLITSLDKRIFWEMIRAIVELPEISESCSHTNVIRNAKDIATLLKKTEYKVLWTPDVADILPKSILAELVVAAYVVK
jgi:hypothetical protein